MPSDPAPTALQRYFTQGGSQADAQRGSTAEVFIEAKLPRRRSEGTLRAVRTVSPQGIVSYDPASMQWTGDGSIKKDVIARYLEADITASKNPPGDIGINERNYRFDDKGTRTVDGKAIRVVGLQPRKKRIGLFKGEIWLDEATGLPLREEGEFVRSPSVFLRKVSFSREYRLQDGASLPKQINTRIETRVVGPAELSVRFDEFRRQAAQPAASAAAMPSRLP